MDSQRGGCWHIQVTLVRASLILVGATISCGGAVDGKPPPLAPTFAIATPVLPHAEFTVVPAELADPGILDRIPHRTRVRRLGSAWMRESEGEATKRSGKDTDFVLPVIGESRSRIRVAFEDDDARMALWIAREDTWSVVALPIELSDAAGIARRDAGVFVKRGAPVVLGEQNDKRRAVRVHDDQLELAGHVPQAVLANIWLAEPGDPPVAFDMSHHDGWMPSPDQRTRVKLKIDTKIRAAPDGKAAVIATVSSADVMGVIARDLGDYRQIEIARPYARVLGFVAAAEVSHTEEEWETHGTGSGHGFGMSHADSIDVPPGTCLFDRADGEVIGVQTKLTTRLGRLGRDSKWSEIHVGTNWTVASVYIRDLSDDPKQPRWESCAQTPHR